LDPEKVFDEALHLEISSSRDVGTINISLSSTGGNCLSLIGKSDDLCRNSAQLVLDPFKKPEIFSLLPLDGRVGESDIVAKVCVASDCIFKTTTISFVAGPVDHISMNFPFARVAVEGRLPFSLSAFDGFNNNI